MSECKINPVSSRVCDRGTHSCDITHERLSAVDRRAEILSLCAEAASLEQKIQMADSIPDDKRGEILSHAQSLSGTLYMIAETYLAPPGVM